MHKPYSIGGRVGGWNSMMLVSLSGYTYKNKKGNEQASEDLEEKRMDVNKCSSSNNEKKHVEF